MFWYKGPENIMSLVLSGGGSRGAYEAGVLEYIRTETPKALRTHPLFKVIVGSSVGAINASFWCSYAHKPEDQARLMAKLWSELKTSNIYKKGPIPFSKFVFKSLVGISSHLIGVKGFAKEGDKTLNFKSLFDTEPFQKYLLKNLPFGNIDLNLKRGLFNALAVSGSNLYSGKVDVFLHRRDAFQYEPHPYFLETKIIAKHIMASAALPILFPPVKIKNHYYNDGGFRMKTPLMPAVHLGSNMLFVIGTRSHVDKVEESKMPAQLPTLAEIIENTFTGALEERLEADTRYINRMNKVLEDVLQHLGQRSFDKFCTQNRVRPIEILTISPSINISDLVDDQLRESFRNLSSMGSVEKAILRLLEVDVESGSDLLSYFMFEPSFINELISLGFRDAKANRDQIIDFLERGTNITDG